MIRSFPSVIMIDSDDSSNNTSDDNSENDLSSNENLDSPSKPIKKYTFVETEEKNIQKTLRYESETSYMEQQLLNLNPGTDLDTQLLSNTCALVHKCLMKHWNVISTQIAFAKPTRK